MLFDDLLSVGPASINSLSKLDNGSILADLDANSVAPCRNLGGNPCDKSALTKCWDVHYAPADKFAIYLSQLLLDHQEMLRMR